MNIFVLLGNGRSIQQYGCKYKFSYKYDKNLETWVISWLHGCFYYFYFYYHFSDLVCLIKLIGILSM